MVGLRAEPKTSGSQFSSELPPRESDRPAWKVPAQTMALGDEWLWGMRRETRRNARLWSKTTTSTFFFPLLSYFDDFFLP